MKGLGELIFEAKGSALNRNASEVIYQAADGVLQKVSAKYYLATGSTAPFICCVDPDGTVTFNDRLTAPKIERNPVAEPVLSAVQEFNRLASGADDLERIAEKMGEAVK